MKVYILLYISFDLTEVLGVYSTKAKAIAARNKAQFAEHECDIITKDFDKVYPR